MHAKTAIGTAALGRWADLAGMLALASGAALNSVSSGYGLFGQMPGNVLLAFKPRAKARN